MTGPAFSDRVTGCVTFFGKVLREKKMKKVTRKCCHDLSPVTNLSRGKTATIWS